MKIRFERIENEARGAYERFFFKEICSMNVADRMDFTIPLPQIKGLYFTSVQDTVERLTALSGRLSTFQWRNCIFAPINKSAKPKDIYAEVFSQLKSKVPSLFVRSYVYLIFIKHEASSMTSLGLKDTIKPAKVCPSTNDFQVYYWNTKYEVKLNSNKRNLFGDLGASLVKNDDAHVAVSDISEAGGIEGNPQKLFIVHNPVQELQRIQDANSDIIDAFRAFNNELPLVDQTKQYLDTIAQELDKNVNARVLVEGPARSGKTVLAMSLLARYPKSKMLLMNWYFYSALNDAFKIWSKLSKDEITQLFTMPFKTRDAVMPGRLRYVEFPCYQADPRLIDVALRAISRPMSELPKWYIHTSEAPAPANGLVNEERIKPVTNKAAGDLQAVNLCTGFSFQIVEIVKQYDDGSASVKKVAGMSNISTSEHQKARLLEYKSQVDAGRGGQYIAEIIKSISDALHESTQRFFHHSIEYYDGCWINRGNPTTCNISSHDLLICDEVQRLGVIGSYGDRDRFDETRQIFKSRQSFLCGDDYQMLNPIYDKGIRAIEEIAGMHITKIALPDSIGVPAEVGRLMRYLLHEQPVPVRCSGFEVIILDNDDAKLVELFEADGSTKKHYAIPSNYGFYAEEPVISRAKCAKHKAGDCEPSCEHRKIPMLTMQLRKQFKFFCSEAIMPNFALSAYELISREVESIYIKLPSNIGLDVIKQPITQEATGTGNARNWKKQHLYVLMTRATMRLVISVENKGLYEDLSVRLGQVNSL